MPLVYRSGCNRGLRGDGVGSPGKDPDSAGRSGEQQRAEHAYTGPGPRPPDGRHAAQAHASLITRSAFPPITFSMSASE